MENNERIQSDKLIGIRGAIEYLYKAGVSSRITKKKISDATKILYPKQKQYQISTVSLSNDFYKKKVPEIISEVFKVKEPYQYLEFARERKKEITEAKVKQVVRYVKKLAKKIRENEVITDRPLPTKSFLAKNIKNNLGYTYNFSIKTYEWIYYDCFLNEIISSENSSEPKDNNRYISFEKYNKLAQEKKRIENELNNIMLGKYVNLTGRNSNKFLFDKGDGYDKLHNTIIKTDKLLKLFEKSNFIFDKQKNVNAFKLINYIIENCTDET
ncbi:hypothetical protein EYB33_15170 [Lysinibacillus sphaericus]|uniref:hypothetical protein n=1 Tax=Lysinibacillus sphaericus TaxID=1421 RepID=UPI001E581A3D|nr:hypothetical protein [Lysinibacillus sphaericus]UDK97565.1 hypothetical protein EYB33_15170 [Lysinibacillus sphaericus]